MFLEKVVWKFTAEHLCRKAISVKLQSNFIEITLRHVCSAVNLLHIFRIPILQNTSGGLLLRQDVILKSLILKCLNHLIFRGSQWSTCKLQQYLTLSWRRPLSYRNQSIDLLCKSMDWFLYDNGLRYERVKYDSQPSTRNCLIHAYVNVIRSY